MRRSETNSTESQPIVFAIIVIPAEECEIFKACSQRTIVKAKETLLQIG